MTSSRLRARDVHPPDRNLDLAEMMSEADRYLRSLARKTGEPAFMRASNALYQQSPGRPSIDDHRLIEEAQWLLEHGKARTLNHALRKVAMTIVDEDGVKAVAERLRRKIAAKGKNRSTKMF